MLKGKGGVEMNFGRILAATDGTEPAQRGVQLAVRLAKRDQAELVLLAPVHIPHHMVIAGNLNPHAFHRHVEKLARQYLSDAVRYLREEGVGAEVKVVVGPPTETILGEIELIKPDLVVMGRAGWVEPKDLILGSVSSRVAQQAKVPVLLVP